MTDRLDLGISIILATVPLSLALYLAGLRVALWLIGGAA